MSAPKTMNRITRVETRVVIIERPCSSASLSAKALAEDASPYCSMASAGWRLATAAVASSTGPTRSSAVLGSPVRSNWTSAECLSLEISGLVTLVTIFCLETVLVTSATAALNAGSLALALLLWTSTISPDFSGKPASSRITAAWRLSPFSDWESFGSTWPSDWPTMKTMTMNASQPKMAVLRCRALQCPARAAMPLGLGVKTIPLQRGSWSWTGESTFGDLYSAGVAGVWGVPHDPRWGCGCPPGEGVVIICGDGTERGVPLDLRGPADVPHRAARL